MSGNPPHDDRLAEAREEASYILKLSEQEVSDLFYRESMRRNLTRLVRHFDRLVEAGGSDHALGRRALERLGFWC